MDEIVIFPGISERYNTIGALECAATGGTAKEIAAAMGCSVTQLFREERKHAAFAQAIKQARAQGYLIRGESLLTIVEDNPNADMKELELKSSNIKWHLSKVHASVFGDKLALQVEHVDIRGALEEARSRVPRVVNPPLLPPAVDPFER